MQNQEVSGFLVSRYTETMQNNTQGDTLSVTPDASPSHDMPSDNLSGDAYAAKQAQKMMAQMAKAMAPDATDTVEEEQPVAEDESASEAEAPVTDPEAKEQPEGEEQTDPEEDDVLSKFEPKIQERLNKRIGKEVEKRRLAEEKAAAEAADKARLQEELNALRQQQDQPQQQPEPVVVKSDDPNDLTANAATEADLAKVEQEARGTLDFLEDNEALIQRAIARDDDTVKLSDGTEYRVDGLLKAKRLAKQQIERYVPARKGYLQQRNQSVHVAQQKFPALFKRDTQEYQTLQQTLRQYPVLRTVPNIELMFGYALVGVSAEAAQAKAAEASKAVKPASATPPKTGADTATVSPAKPKTVSSPRKAAEARLAQATKEFENSNGDERAYQKVQLLRAELKKLK